MPPALRKDLNETKKRDRKSLSYDFKHEVLKRVESGVHRSIVGRELGLADSTVRYIIKNAHKIKNHFTEPASSTTPQRFYARVSLYDELDKRLYAFIEDMTLKNNVPITPRMITDEAKLLFTELKATHKGPKHFYATAGWYSNFERRAKERNIDITGRVSTSTQDSTDFPNKLQQIIESKKYPQKLVFTVSATELYWKRFPSCISTLGHRDDSSRKMSVNERVTVLVGGNAEGDCLLTPLVVHGGDSETSPTLNDYGDGQVPIIWRTNIDAHISKEIIYDWYVNYFCPYVKEYCTKNLLEPKALLLLDSALGLSVGSSSILHTDVMVLPEGVQSPLEKGAVATFKAAYHYRVVELILNDVNVQCRQALCEWLESFDILKSLCLMAEVWKRMEQRVMNRVWGEVWPQAVTWEGRVLDDKDATVRAIVDKIVGSGLGNTSREEVDQLVSSIQHNEDNCEAEENVATSEDHIGDDYDNDSLHTQDEIPGQQVGDKLTTEVLETALNHIDTAFELLERHDTDWERISSVRRIINDGVSCYKEMLISRRGKPKQNTIYGFLKSATRKPTSPEPEIVD